MPGNPLGKLTTFSRLPNRLGRGNLLPIPHPLDAFGVRSRPWRLRRLKPPTQLSPPYPCLLDPPLVLIFSTDDDDNDDDNDDGL